jgi:DNA mismatch repair ATPase MutS
MYYVKVATAQEKETLSKTLPMYTAYRNIRAQCQEYRQQNTELQEMLAQAQEKHREEVHCLQAQLQQQCSAQHSAPCSHMATVTSELHMLAQLQHYAFLAAHHACSPKMPR